MTVRIICDSSLNIPNAALGALNIIEVPASIIFGDEVYLNKVEMLPEEFYRRLNALAKDASLPTTTQPTPGQFSAALEQAKTEGATAALITTVSAKLSGTHNSAVQAVADEKDIPVIVHDTASASLGGGWQTIVAGEMAQAGASPAEIAAALPGVLERTYTGMTVDTLRFLVAGGRLSPIQGMMGTVLSIKPMITMEDGILKPVGRERGRKRSKQALIEMIRSRAGDKPVRLAVTHSNVAAEAAEFAKQAAQALNVTELIIEELGPVLAALAGPGILALMALGIEP